MHIYMYIYIYIYTHVYIYIYYIDHYRSIYLSARLAELASAFGTGEEQCMPVYIIIHITYTYV